MVRATNNQPAEMQSYVIHRRAEAKNNNRNIICDWTASNQDSIPARDNTVPRLSNRNSGDEANAQQHRATPEGEGRRRAYQHLLPERKSNSGCDTLLHTTKIGVCSHVRHNTGRGSKSSTRELGDSWTASSTWKVSRSISFIQDGETGIVPAQAGGKASRTHT